jgi:hypothetical protein
MLLFLLAYAGGVLTILSPCILPVQAAPDNPHDWSPETCIGYGRAKKFASSGGALHGVPHDYAMLSAPALNQWGLAGSWTVHGDHAVSDLPRAKIVYRFHARDLHLVLGPSADGRPVRFRVTMDGKPPLADHGADVDEQGNGSVTAQRLYQLVRQQGKVDDRTFEIEFLDPGAQAFAFTFG